MRFPVVSLIHATGFLHFSLPDFIYLVDIESRRDLGMNSPPQRDRRSSGKEGRRKKVSLGMYLLSMRV